MASRKTQKYFSDDFINKLAGYTAGHLSEKNFEELSNLFKNEAGQHYFTFSSESNLLRIISGMFDKVSFLIDCLRYPHFVEVVTVISVNSNYLTDILVKNPEFFYLIVNPSRLNQKLSSTDFKSVVKQTTSIYKSFSSKVNSLRTLKRKEILKIGTKDVLGTSSLKETTEELSVLAKCITEELFRLCYEENISKQNISFNERSYCIAALGKLGGNELNYSSDIDLIIFYDKNEEISNKTFSQFLTDVTKLFVESATAITHNGFLYRVDFRLRPDGRNAPLTRSLQEYLSYYESRGEDWERQMLIKASFAGGDEKLFDRFIQYIQPFIYPISFLVSPTEQIKRIKLNIENNLSGNENIKLISGGIRDIEFSVQCLQLLNGGRNKVIKKTNTLDAIDRLETVTLLKKDEAEILRSAYIFYRKIEHYLQLMNDKQTHTIPTYGETLDKMSSFLGYKSSSDFNIDVVRKRKRVLKIYQSILGAKPDNQKNLFKLADIKFDQPVSAEKDLLYLREGKGLLGQKEFDKKSIHRFQKIENILIQYLSKAVYPDLVLKNFVRIIRQATFPSILYEEFKEDKKLFAAFLKLCETSQKTIDLFAEDNELREIFITRKVFDKIRRNDLKNFTTKKLLFSLSVQLNAGLISSEQLSKILSDYFSIKISEEARLFFPEELEYCIASMGSFSTKQMTFSSDVDLIFIINKADSDTDNQKLFQVFLLKLKEHFKPFDVDCRLRPEGKSSQLVWEINSYRNYINSRARIWELQALTKIGFISGEKKLLAQIVNSCIKRLREESKQNLKSEMLEMRRKIYPANLSSLTNTINLKKGRGGLIDIEFVVQLIMFMHPESYRKLIGKNILKIIDFFTEETKVYSDLKILKDNYRFLKIIEMTNQNVFNVSTNVLPDDNKKLTLIARELKLESGPILFDKINLILKQNSTAFQKFLN